MSNPRQQRPEQVLIREFVRSLLDERVITQEGLTDAFVTAYVDMIPPGKDAPKFDPVHRHDTVDMKRKKDAANLKKLWRAIDGATFFPLAFRAPLIAALEASKKGLGVRLQQQLLHNEGLYHLPIDASGKAPAVYAELLKEFAEFNEALVDDMGDDGVLNSKNTRDQLLDSVEKHFAMLRELDRNIDQGETP